MAQTAIIVPVPEAEKTVDLLRREHTEDGADGAPAHITLVYPFTDTDQLTAGRVREVRDVLSDFQQFDFVLAALRRFDTDPAVLWLDPAPAQPFVEMTEALVAKFPEHPPYGGQFAGVVPHLTIAQGADSLLDDIEAQVAGALPIHATASSVVILQHLDGRWRRHTPIDLASAAASQASSRP